MNHAFGVRSREAHSAVSLHITGQLRECLPHSPLTAYATECELKPLQTWRLQTMRHGCIDSAPPLRSHSMAFWVRSSEVLQYSHHTEKASVSCGRPDTQRLTLILPKPPYSKQPPYSAKEAAKHMPMVHSYSSDKNDGGKVGLMQSTWVLTCVYAREG